MKKSFTIKEIFLFLMVAIIFVSIFSSSTSPLYSTWSDSPDSPIFQIIGKYWVKGIIPYRDLWDLKGPFIFFVNAVGYWVTGSRLGVYGIQIISLFLTILVVFKTVRQYFPRSSSFFITLLALAGLSYTYERGNLTEEYILYPLSLSFYYILRWINDYEDKGIIQHPWKPSIIYGIVVGLCFMSRLTNALALCSAVGVISITLIYHKTYWNLIANVLAFLVGFAITTTPFLIYFYHHNALTEMWNGTFLFALKYAANSELNLSFPSIFRCILFYINSILLILVSILMVLHSKKFSLRFIIYLNTAALPFIWFCNSNGFGHYGMIVFPLFCLSVTEISKIKPALMPYLFTLFLAIGTKSIINYIFVFNQENSSVTYELEFLGQVDNIDYSSFVAYNCDPNIYLALNVCPAVKNFALQDFAISHSNLKLFSFDKLMKTFIIESFQQKKPKWILLAYNKDSKPIIHHFLSINYQLVMCDATKKLKLYKKNDNK